MAQSCGRWRRQCFDDDFFRGSGRAGRGEERAVAVETRGWMQEEDILPAPRVQRVEAEHTGLTAEPARLMDRATAAVGPQDRASDELDIPAFLRRGK